MAPKRVVLGSRAGIPQSLGEQRPPRDVQRSSEMPTSRDSSSRGHKTRSLIVTQSRAPTPRVELSQEDEVEDVKNAGP